MTVSTTSERIWEAGLNTGFESTGPDMNFKDTGMPAYWYTIQMCVTFTHLLVYFMHHG
jgi:hypothetical protein